jgi:hypothetical protein
VKLFFSGVGGGAQAIEVENLCVTFFSFILVSLRVPRNWYYTVSFTVRGRPVFVQFLWQLSLFVTLPVCPVRNPPPFLIYRRITCCASHRASSIQTEMVVMIT